MKLRRVAELAIVGLRFAGITAAPPPDVNDKDYGSETSVDCEVSAWTYSACEGGRQVRTRYVVQDPSGRGGRLCPVLEQTVWCEPVHCDVSEWSAFSPCDATGHKTRTREVIIEPVYGGRSCPHLEDRKLCRSDECRVSFWGEWACNPSSGVQTRARHVLNAYHKLNSSSCPPLAEAKLCDPIDCVLGDTFVPAGECDPYSGTQKFHLQVLQEPKYAGNKCKQQVEVRTCAVNCHVSEFGAWGACDSVTGLRRRSRVEVISPKNGGDGCPLLVDEEKCPVGCQMSEFGDWSACDPLTGTRTRSRRILRHTLNGGDECPSVTEETEKCDVDCVVKYTAWSTCGPNSVTQSRSGTVLVPAQNNGRPCPPASVLEHEERECEGKVDCVCKWEEWSECWSDGYEYRWRHVTVEPQHGGKKCPPLDKRKQRRPCQVPSAKE